MVTQTATICSLSSHHVHLPSGESPVGEEAVDNAVSQGVHSQRPDLLEV